MRIVTRRRMTVCCAILAALLFAVGLFGLCVPMGAQAEEVTPAKIVTAADGVTVTPEKLNTGATADDGHDVTGLTVEGGAGYSATINGVFKDDVKLDFAFLSQKLSGNETEFTGAGAFSFRVTDAGDPSQYFDIVMGPVTYWGTTFTLPYVQYGSEIRWRQHGADGGGTIFNESVPTASNEEKYIYAFAAIPFAGADRNHESSYIKLSWEGDVLNVSVMCGHNYATDRQEIVIASFDGTTALNSGAKEFGLDKLTGMKENGFTISFGSDYEDTSAPENNGTDICLTGLTVGAEAYDLKGSAAFEAEPQWYTDYQSRATITLAAVPAAYWNRAFGAYTVPAATYTTVGNSEPQDVASVKLTKDGTEVTISDGKATFTEDGTYTLTYTAIEESSAVGNTLSYTVNVGAYLPAKDIIDGEGVTAGKLNTGAVEGDGYDVTGLTVEGGAGYSATLNGVFKEDVKLDFALLSKIAAIGGNGFGGKGRLTFRIADAGDPDTYFEIVIRSEDWFGSSRNFAYVLYDGAIRWRVHGADGGGDIFGVDVLENTAMAQYAYAAIPFDGADANTENSYIKLYWTGADKDILNVSVMCGHNYTTDRQEIVIASFDGTEALDNTTKAYGLDKLTGMKENGFTISFGSDYTDENNPENNGTDICFKKITVGGKEYDLSAAVLTETGADWYDAYENIVRWDVEGSEEGAVPAGREYTVRTATYSLNDGVTTGQSPAKTEYARLGAEGESEPSSWTAVKEGKFTPDQAGVYEIRYTAVENGSNLNNTHSYRVTVRAVRQIAKPTLSESSKTYTGQEQSVTVMENDDYTVTGTLSATNAGTYTVIVSLKDKEFTEWADGGTEDVTLSWTIAKATPVIDAKELQSAEYDGEAQDVTASIAGVNGETLDITVTWYSDAQHENGMSAAPVDPGTYYAVLSYAGSDNYNAAASVNVTFTVEKGKVKKPAAPTDTTYNGLEQTALESSELYTVTNGKQTDVGEYTVTVSLKNTQYSAWEDGTTDDLTFTWKIAKATPVIDAKELQSAEYDGEAQAVQATVKGENGETFAVTVKWYADAQHTDEMESAPVEAGTYYAVLSFAGNENYTAAENVEVTFTVTEKAPEPVEPDPGPDTDPDPVEPDPVDPGPAEPEPEEPAEEGGCGSSAVGVSIAGAAAAIAAAAAAMRKRKK